ncbi:hypothetical protein [Alicyclobacillus dauci]|uniref:Uncharacterized protein n=1 Tax=Alicyclobacillus dauci TaxID=1475485 RepID=A0ABY6Z1H3_9BACL|nr:hypothetical protein [Alicyclobacillus dauci]WAH35825.1 hypothetical protein NZD86_16335 [Alicyclobacillus dauci]
MTTRFSLAELGDMLHVPVEQVRQAVEALAEELTGESFLYNERTWRIAPSDVKRIQTWLATHARETNELHRPRARNVRIKRIKPAEETGE